MRQGLWVFAALAAGIALGAWAGDGHDDVAAILRQISILGGVWLDALKMTLVPLVFALLVAAIGGVAERAAAGPMARRALALFAGAIVLAAIYGLSAANLALDLFPVSPEAVAALVPSTAPPEATPVEFGAWLRSLIPTNVVAAASQDAFLPVVVFAVVFGFAMTRLEPDRRALLTTIFQAIGDAMIQIVRWVLALAPLGVFGLALALGLDGGGAAAGALAHYVAIVAGVTFGIVVLATLVTLAAARTPLLVTLRALAPVQVVAASTQSSLASLPAMLAAALGPLGVRPQTAEFVLPFAVAMFRLTSPVANLSVVAYVAHVYGVEPGWAEMAAGVAVAFAVSVSSVGLPGQTSFFSSIAPICLAMGVPVTLLPILLAVEIIPDVFRTVGNVTGDLAATVIMDRRRDAPTSEAPTGEAPP
ncbi:MAG: cation:dicarboxylase symporter family transporter [Alphaproteobacteria bacterium]|nr:cation:dicarboxylase symporter family transporter [Alphaproteobacteria bacterium]